VLPICIILTFWTKWVAAGSDNAQSCEVSLDGHALAKGTSPSFTAPLHSCLALSGTSDLDRLDND
jgi:hypothetical protein